MNVKPEKWLKVTKSGLYCEPGDFYIDPLLPVDKAVITHGHADHARPNHKNVLAIRQTLNIMDHRYKGYSGETQQAIAYGEVLNIKDVSVSMIPAGHILGSAQIILEYAGTRIIVSGDYKTRRDPTCDMFKVIPCDVFITEATFGLPVFHHPTDSHEINKILHSLKLFPERTVLIGAYALGKCQRIICLLREAGYDDIIYLHGAMMGLCEVYTQNGIDLGRIEQMMEKDKESLKGKIVLAPPSAIHDRWSRRLAEPVTAVASGWMTVRARARQKLVDLPLVISDHADWDELIQTIKDVQASEIWVTHGREDALVHYAINNMGLKARPLDLGYEDED